MTDSRPAAPTGETPEPRPAKPHVSWTPDARFDGNPSRPYHSCDLCGATDTSLMLTPDGKKTCFLRCGRGAPSGEEAETLTPGAVLAHLHALWTYAERGDKEKWSERAATLSKAIAAQATELAALRARVEELETDKERLDAISKPGASTRVHLMATENRADPPMRRVAMVSIPTGPHSSYTCDRRSLREAIDAALPKRAALAPRQTTGSQS